MKARFAFALLTVLPVLVSAMYAAEMAVNFRSLALEDAEKAAAAEGKIVFIDFYTTWCGPCKMLDAQTWTDAKVGQLLGEKAVALKLDAEKEGRDAAKRYKIDAYPTLLLLKPDGTEIDRLVGFREPARFLDEFTQSTNGNTSMKRAATAVAAAGSDDDIVKARQTYAKQLAQKGQYAEALDEYLWCFDEGMAKSPRYSGVRLSFLLSEIKSLGRNYPAALAALRERCDTAEQHWAENINTRQAGADFAALCSTLDQNDRLLAAFDRFPKGDARRTALGFRVTRLLQDKQRYADALESKPYRAMLLPMDGARRLPPLIGPDGEDVNRRMTIGNALDAIEILAGADDLDHAREMMGKLASYDATEATKAQVAERLKKAGHPELGQD